MNAMRSNKTEGLVGKPFNLSNLICYQECSVVSRTIISKDTGNVTLFSFSLGQGLSEHTTLFDAIVYILDGESEIYHFW